MRSATQIALLLALSTEARADRFALVPPRAVLREAPSEDSPRYGPAAGIFGDEPTVFRVVRSDGDWLQLETAPVRGDDHCHGSPPDAGGLQLRFFVLQRDVQPVVTRKLTIPFPDGTGVTLWPGMAVRAVNGGLHAAQLGEFRPRVKLPADAIGRVYAPEKLQHDIVARQQIKAADFSLARLAGAGVERLTSSAFESFPIAVDELRRLPGEQAIVSVRMRCGELKLRVPRELIAPIDNQDILGGLVGRGEGVAFRVRKGAPVFFRSGRPAGVALESFAAGEATANAGDRRCTRHPLSFGDLPRNWVEICFDAADVTAK